MFWQSVVGKLWFTFLLLVSVVLSFLMIMLLQSFGRFHVNEAESQLANHANMIVSIYESYPSTSEALQTISQYIDSFSLDAIIIENGEKVYSSVSYAPVEVIVDHESLSQVFAGKQVVKTEGDFPHLRDEGDEEHEIMIVGVPLPTGQSENSAVFVYQPLSSIKETSNETKKIIYYSAAIALILTTFFAFFLSTRITLPLRKMRQAALEMAEGKFETKIPVITYDEIGQLSIAINRMGRDLKANIQALNQEKEQLARILESMADGVITLDRNGRVVLTNPPADRFIEMWMYENGKGEEEKGTVPKEIRDLFESVVVLGKEQVTEVELQGRSWSILMTPLYDQNKTRGVVVVLRDMTEERRNDKLRKDFIANVSHELRTPIAMLQGYSEAIIDDIVTSDAEKKEIAKIIYEESLRMGRLVNELLDIARMEAGHIELNKKPVEIASFVEWIVHKFQGLARENGIRLTYELKNASGQIEFDTDRIEQVLTNLIHNAIHHTDNGGEVKLVVSCDEKRCRFDVIDTGKGIPEEDLPYVFERFYKADKSRTRKQGGTGLGLSIAKNIVEAHKGTISVHSKLNEGTTFTFYLPRKNA